MTMSAGLRSPKNSRSVIHASAPLAVAVRHCCLAAVRAGDHLDDREAESRAARTARVVGTAEPVERPSREAGGNPGPSSATWSSTPSPFTWTKSSTAPSPYTSALSTRLPSACSSLAGSASTKASVPLDTATLRPRSRAAAFETGRHVFEDFARRDPRAPNRKLSLIRSRDQKQVLCQVRQPFRLLRRRAQRLLELIVRARPAQRELELRAQQRQRCTQLVARVGDEAPFVLERGLEPLQHVVQRFRELRDLVPSGGNGQARAGSRGGDRSRTPPHRLDRPKRRGGEQVPGKDPSARTAGPPRTSSRARRCNASSRGPSVCATTSTARFVCRRAGTASSRQSPLRPGDVRAPPNSLPSSARGSDRRRRERGQVRRHRLDHPAVRRDQLRHGDTARTRHGRSRLDRDPGGPPIRLPGRRGSGRSTPAARRRRVRRRRSPSQPGRRPSRPRKEA